MQLRLALSNILSSLLLWLRGDIYSNNNYDISISECDVCLFPYSVIITIIDNDGDLSG